MKLALHQSATVVPMRYDVETSNMTELAAAVAHLLATVIEERRDLSSMSGIVADTAYRLLLA
jgi:DNA-binding transcriptional regulator LsrR (DeoR family)